MCKFWHGVLICSEFDILVPERIELSQYGIVKFERMVAACSLK